MCYTNNATHNLVYYREAFWSNSGLEAANPDFHYWTPHGEQDVGCGRGFVAFWLK